MPPPEKLLDAVKSGCIVSGWNVTFEWYVWNNIGVKRYGWPPLPIEQTECSMARAKRFSIPASLKNASLYLGTAEKLSDGKRLIQKLTRPHTPTKNREDYRWTPVTAPEDFKQFYFYCMQDVVSEFETQMRIPILSGSELDIWKTDQRINARGVQVDMETLDSALLILEQAEKKYNAELCDLTKGEVPTVGSVGKFIQWLATKGVYVNSIDKDSVAELLQDKRLNTEAYRALEIRSLLGNSNIKKLRTIKLQVSEDGRLRDSYKYCGADRTGRWSSGGAQLQNLTAKGPAAARCNNCNTIHGGNALTPGCPRCGNFLDIDHLKEWTPEAVSQAVEDIRNKSLDYIEVVWGDPINCLTGVIRGLFIPDKGHRFICVDYSAIEAVVLACLSRCQWRIDVFNGHGKIYEMSASKITGTPMRVYEEYKAEHGVDHPDRKKIGKVAELASGFQGWVGAWQAFGAEMDEASIKEAILAWRAASPEIVEFWGGQYKWCGPGKWDYIAELHGVEGAAIQALLSPGQCFGHNDISYGLFDGTLYCRLPSGRFLHYHNARLIDGCDPLNRGPSFRILYDGVVRNAAGWGTLETYGGKLTENICQAVARDIQAPALVRCEAAGYKTVMHTHDEICAEVPENTGSIDEIASIMCERPAWAMDWPIKAAGWEGYRYRKD